MQESFSVSGQESPKLEVFMQYASPGADQIDLPAKFFLNQKGVDYCVRSRIPLRDLRAFDGEKSLGFDWPRCHAESLERMVVGNMLLRIELDRSEFISVRSPLIAMTRSVLYGAVIGRFRVDLKRRLVSQPRTAKILVNPSISMLFSSPAALASALRSRSAEIGDLRAQLRQDCEGRASQPGRFDDVVEAKRLCARLLDAADGDSMLILSLAPSGSIGPAAETVLAYAGKMGLAEQLALLLVEFIQIAEKSYLRSMAEHDRYARSHPEDLPRLLAEPEFRARLIDAGSRMGDVMTLRISFGGSRHDQGAPADIAIALRTKGLIDRVNRPDSETKRGKSVRTTDLESLLKSAARDDSYADLSLAYYAGFEQACAGEGMVFSSSVVLDEMKNESTATMRIAI
jgi:hypothetical protein